MPDRRHSPIGQDLIIEMSLGLYELKLKTMVKGPTILTKRQQASFCHHLVRFTIRGGRGIALPSKAAASRGADKRACVLAIDLYRICTFKAELRLSAEKSETRQNWHISTYHYKEPELPKRECQRAGTGACNTST